MTVLRYEIPISVTLVSPFATRGLVVDRASIDLPLARDQEGRFILPGTLITGVLRAALRRLAEAAAGDIPLGGQTRKLTQDRADLFGRASEEDDERSLDAWRVSNTPHRAQLAIRDLVVTPASLAHQLQRRQDYPRIRVDKDTGSVGEGFLQFVEMPFAIGRTVTFSGIADLRRGAVSPERAVALLEKLLALAPALGAIKSSGFGRLADVGFSVGAATEVVTSARRSRAPSAGDPIQVIYSIDRPFLVGGRMASANLFKGSFVVPGAAIKGTLATAVEDAGLGGAAMADLLSRITIGHAFPQPVDAQGEPTAGPWRPLPLSLATAEVGQGPHRHTKLYDRLRADRDSPLPKDGERTLVLSFAPDFKGDDDRIRADLGLAKGGLAYDVRTRTKIDEGTGVAAYDRAAEAGQLFSYAAVKSKDHVWVGRIVLPEGADPALVADIVGLLETGIVGLGKTGAMLGAVFGQPTAATATPAPPYALTLMTPAVLNDLEALNAHRSLFDDYGAYWRALGYRLVRFFAAQELEGGYVALRYPPRPGSCSSYLLTQPGSVFLVEPEEAATPIVELLTFGLPPNGWLKNPTWRTTPFLRENGFGEVRLNAVDHAALRQGRDLAARQEHAA